MKQKNRIRLHRNLHAQTTPYPHANRWFKRGVVVLGIGIVVGIYVFAGSDGQEPAQKAPKQILGEQVSAPEQKLLIYQIKKGDTLFNLSQRYGVTWQALAELNQLDEPFILKIGQEIKIPQ